MPRLQISERRIDDVTVLTLNGRLVLEEGDIPLCEHVDRLIAEGRILVVVNLQAVTYLDSSGVGCLAAKYSSLRKRGGDLKLVCPSPRCRRILEITGLLPVFRPLPSDDAAVRSLGAARDVLV